MFAPPCSCCTPPALRSLRDKLRKITFGVLEITLFVLKTTLFVLKTNSGEVDLDENCFVIVMVIVVLCWIRLGVTTTVSKSVFKHLMALNSHFLRK